MTMADEKNAVQQLDEELDERTGELIDANAKMTSICRKQAQEQMKIALAYEGLAEMARVCADLNAQMAKAAAEITGDIIKSEWGLIDDDELDDEDFDDDDDEEDEDEDE